VVGVVTRVVVSLLGRLLGRVPAFLAVIDTVAGVAVVAGAAYFAIRLLLIARRRLLWRVRRKLILSYIFIGFVPAILIVTFFVLSGLLLFFNFSSYLVQNKLRAVEARAQSFALSTALEIQHAGARAASDILARRQRAAVREFPGASFAIVPAGERCAPGGRRVAGGAAAALSPVTAGPWSHVEPPGALPAWVDCGGFSGVLAYQRPMVKPAAGAPAPTATIWAGGASIATPQAGAPTAHLFVRAAALPEVQQPELAVIVDLPLSDAIYRQFRSETGVSVTNTTAVQYGEPNEAHPLAGHSGAEPAPPDPAKASGLRWVTYYEYRDWSTGATGELSVATELSLAEIYNSLSATQGLLGGRQYAQLLLTALFIVAGLFLVIEVVALATGLALAKSITGSVHELFTGTERVRQGDFTHKIAVKTADQLGELSVSFNSMTASIADLLRQAAEKKRLEEELRIAREIQMSLLPQGPLVMRGLSVTALCVPAREVGGDYYDFFRLGERRLGVLIADVSGKGTSAALYMAELKGLVLSLSRIHTSPRDLMLAANRIIAANLDARSFITMTYAVVDLDARTMTYARAGHTPLMYVPGDPSRPDRHVRVLAPDGLVLGLNIDDGEMFERLLVEQTLPLHAGDLAMFFTDGVTDAMNGAGECFGEGRLGTLIEAHAHLASDELRRRVLDEIEAFVGGAPQHDDMTMIFLKVDDPEAASTISGEPAELRAASREKAR
jgi:sigma-B regulation protein RsbU (phosphoserine phosphatase)